MTDINCRQKGDLRRMMVKSFQDYHRSDYRDPGVASDWELWRAAWRAAGVGLNELLDRNPQRSERNE